MQTSERRRSERRASGTSSRLALVTVATADFEEAGRRSPPTLRSLDAIQLAVALSLGDELRSVLTYDQGMRDGAIASGLRCEAPGMSDDA